MALRAYVSATFKDLQPHRRIVQVVLERFGYENVAMEYYFAEDVRPLDKCLRDVAECDLYVGIFAWRYGFVPETDNPEKLSVTEREYRLAVELKKPRLLFVIDEDADWPAKFMDIDRSNVARLHAAVRSDRLGGTFSTPDSLEARLSAALETRGGAPMLAAGIDVAGYTRFLKRRYNILDLDALTEPARDEYLQLRLQSVFVEPNAKEDSPPLELPKEAWALLVSRQSMSPAELPEALAEDAPAELQAAYASKPSRRVLQILADPDNRCTIILGDPGSGKSTLLRYLVLSLLDNPDALGPAFSGHLPFLIDLKAYTALRRDGKCETFGDYYDVMAKQEECPVTSKTLSAYFKSKQPAVVLFDGIDEIFDLAEQETVTRQIAAFADAHPHARIIVTSRIIGYRRTILTQAGFRHFTLQDFDEQQVTDFVRQWYTLTLGNRPDEASARIERIVDSFDRSPSIRQLSGNPMLLTIMAIIGKHQELPRERWKLYAHATSVLVQHWDVKRHLRNRQLEELMDEEDKKELLRRLAFAMQRGKGGLAGNYIHTEELQAEFESYLRERYQLTKERAVIIAREMIAQFRERNFILSFYGAGVYGFVHRAFLEYFCADAIKTKFERTTELPLEMLKAEIFGKHWQEKPWQEVLRLICGMVGEQYAGELIDYLRTIDYDGKDRANVVLALECLNEVRRLEAIEPQATALLRKLCAVIAEWLGRPWLCDLEALLEPATRIGLQWPNRGWVVDEILRSTKDHDALDTYYIGEFLGRISSDLPAVRDALLAQQPQRQEGNAHWVILPYALASGWPNDSQIFPYLQDRAQMSVAWAPIHAAAKFMGHRPDVSNWLFEMARTDQNDAVIAVVNWLRDDPRALDIAKRAAPSGEVAAFETLEKHLDDPSVRDLIIELSSRRNDYAGKFAREIVDMYNLTPSSQRQT
jgi:GTPase SAR1 family protein